MPEYEDDFDDFDGDDDTEVPENADDRDRFREMRKAARRSRAADREREQAQRELAMVKAGIDTDTRLGQMFLKTYEGPLDKEAVKAAALEVPGLLLEPASPPPPTNADQGASPPPPTPEPQVDPNMTDERDRLHSGGDAPGQINEDPILLGKKRAEEVLVRGGTEEDAMVANLRTLYEAAAEGDDRVIWSPAKHQALASE